MSTRALFIAPCVGLAAVMIPSEHSSAQTPYSADIARFSLGTGTTIGHAVITRPAGYWVGVSMRPDADVEIALSELDAELEVVGSTGLDGPGDDIPEDLKPTSDGGAIMTGRTTSFSEPGLDGPNAFLVKFSSTRSVEWARQYGGPGNDHANRVVQLPDGGYLMVGSTTGQGAGGKDAWLVRTGPDGQPIWSRTYGGPQDDVGNDVLLDENGTIAMVGTTWNIAEGNTILLVQTDGAGEPLRIRAIDLEEPDPWPVHDRKGSVIITRPEGGYYIGGTIGSEMLGVSLASDAFILRIDTATASIGGCNSFHFNTGHTYMNRLWRGESKLEGALEMGAGYGAMVRASTLGMRQWSRYLTLIQPFGMGRTLGAAPTAEGGFVASGYQLLAGGDTSLLVVHGRTSGDLCFQGETELSFTGSTPNEMLITTLGLSSIVSGTSGVINFNGTDGSPNLVSGCTTLSTPEPATEAPLLFPTLTDRLENLRLSPTITGPVALLDAAGRLLSSGTARTDGGINWERGLPLADGLYLLRVHAGGEWIRDLRFVIAH